VICLTARDQSPPAVLIADQLEIWISGTHRLAGMLETDLRDIIPRGRDAADPAEDDKRVESLLSYERQALSAQEIATAFGWILPRSRQAIRQLQDRLLSGGTRLRQTNDGRWKISPNPSIVAATDRERLAQARLRMKGLTTTEALVLRLVVAGLVDEKWENKAKRHETMAAGALLDMGLVITDDHGTTS
jgi:hypothetical protein